jgi:NTE family protein
MPGTALVLSGGSIKGAFQAGAIAELLGSGIKPMAIYGISVGSLNGGFLADRAGKAARAEEEPDWPQIGEELVQFWTERISSFKLIGRERGNVSLLWSIIRGKFEGAIDTGRLRHLVSRTLNEDDLAACPIVFQAGSVDLLTGKLVYADKSNSSRQFREYIIAGTAIPVVMPVSVINQRPLVDGGIRDVALLRSAIREEKAERVFCILCQEEVLEAAVVDHRKILEYGERLMAIVTNEIVNNDIDRARTINRFVETGRLQPPESPEDKDYRYIDLKVVRPKAGLNIELTEFDSDDIRRLVKLGREAAREKL